MRKLILIFALFLIALPSIYAAGYIANNSLYYNASSLTWFDTSLTIDNSSKGSTSGSVVDNPVQDVASTCNNEGASASFGGGSNGKISFLGTEDAFSNMLNFTSCLWFNNTEGGTVEILTARHSSSATAGHWFLSYRDQAGQNQLNFLFVHSQPDNVQLTWNVGADTLEDGSWDFICAQINYVGSMTTAKLFVNGTEVATTSPAFGFPATTINYTIGNNQPGGGGSGDSASGKLDNVMLFNRVLTQSEITALYNNSECVGVTNVTTVSSQNAPTITSYNMTSEGGLGCTAWTADPNTACNTLDTTPTVSITTDINAYCRIGITNSNYTTLGSSRECSGGGTSSHTCTLTAQDELTNETSYVYIGCKNAFDFENSTSTSGGLKVHIYAVDLERFARAAIENGVQNALSSGYTIYTSQKVYARNSANNQVVGTFDKVVKWMNKVWTFNFLTGNDTRVNMFNITPVLYSLEMTNITNSTINTTVYNFIQNTR